METLTAQPPKIEMYDREARAYNDATTWLAETLDGRMRTAFEYSFDGHELYADDGGALKPIFEQAINSARGLIRRRPNLSFELRRRQIEMNEYEDMLLMAKGELPNTMITISDFPQELMDAKQDVGGYNVGRKQTMLRIVTRKPDGRLRMQTQSLDGSNRQALEEIYAGFGLRPESGELLGQRIYEDLDEIEQEFIIDKLTGVYDGSLQSQTGQNYNAGRHQPECHHLETYHFVRSQPDLVGYLTGKMIANELTDSVMFSAAATIAARYEKACLGEDSEVSLGLLTSTHHTGVPPSPEVVEHALQQEMLRVSAIARAEGRTFSGCGASVGAELTAEGQLSASGFGNKADEDEYGSLTFTCPDGHTNQRKAGQLLGSCQHKGCKAKVTC